MLAVLSALFVYRRALISNHLALSIRTITVVDAALPASSLQRRTPDDRRQGRYWMRTCKGRLHTQL
jgi:hypothetical protein